MKWQLSETERGKIKACLHSIEYPKEGAERMSALVKLEGYLDGERQLAYGVCKVYHATLIPLLYSIHTAQNSDVEQARLSLKILNTIAQSCSKKHVLFLLNTDRFKCLATGIDGPDMPIATLAAKVFVTLLKLEDSIKELFWEQHLHQTLRTALTGVLVRLKTAPPEAIPDTLTYISSLLDVLITSAANVRHRQELYGSGYSLCSQLLQTMLDMLEGAPPGTSMSSIYQLSEKLILSVAMLVRENKLNQDDFRKEPKLGMLKKILTKWYSDPSTPVGFKNATELLYSSLQYGNEGVANMLKENVPTFSVDADLNEFMTVLLEGLEALKRHHYDVDVVVRALRVIDEGLGSNEALRSHMCYYFKHCHGAWSLLFLCLNNIDERIMYQACCLTSKLVRSNSMNQEMFLEMDGIETLSEILSDYNLDIQLVGLQILEALKGNGSRIKQISDPTIVDYLLKVISQFPSVFKQAVQHRSNATMPSAASPTHPIVTTSMKAQDTASTNWENQITIVQYSISLIGDMVAHSPLVKAKVLEKPNESGLLHLLSTSYTYIHSFYTSVKGAGPDRKETRTHIRPQTAPGRFSRSGNGNSTGAGNGSDAVSAEAVGETPSPLKKLSSFFIKVLLGVVEVTCRALSNVVRHSPEAQWRFYKNGGTEQIINYMNCLVTFSEGGHEHEAWAKVHRTSCGATLQDISYTGHGLAALQSGGGDDRTSSTAVGKSMYLCQNSWLVHPELVASLLLVLVNTTEANTNIQAALCEPKVRLLLHYLASHPSNVVVNAALLLVSHICFNNSANQRFFATPYIVQRLQSLTAVSYLQLLQSAGLPQHGVEIPWATEHLHLLTPPVESDPASFFAFQSLAYGFVCLANLLQLYPEVSAVILLARVHVSGETFPWTKFLSQCPLLPCYPIQDAALTLLSNIVNGCSEEVKDVVSPQVIDSLVQLVVMDRSDDDTGSATQPAGDGDKEAELKWLGNKAFQLIVNMGQGATKQVVDQLRAMSEAMESHPDLVNTQQPAESKVVEYYKTCDDVDVYNSVISYLPILNGLTYSSEVCRKSCLANGGWDVLTGLLCKTSVELDARVCILFIMSNILAHCQSAAQELYVPPIEGRSMDALAKGILIGQVETSTDDDKNMYTDYVACLFQLCSQLVLRVGSHTIGGKTSKQYFVSATHPHLLQLAVREATQPSSLIGQEALSFILLLAEDDAAAAKFTTTPPVQRLFATCLEDPSLPHSTTMLVKRYSM